MKDKDRGLNSPPPLGRLETLAIVAVIGVLALALGLTALVMPSTTSETQKIGYSQSGEFSYTAKAPAASLYGRDGLSAGEPILSNVVGKVTAAFAYQFKAKAPAEIRGTAGMTAVVRLDAGFSREFVVAPSTTFTGQEVTVSGTLPLDDILRYVRAATESLNNGIAGADITIRPNIKVAGIVGNQALKASFHPALHFTAEGDTLNLSSSDSAPTATPADQLRPRKNDDVSHSQQVPNTISLLVVRPTVPTARLVGLGSAGLCLLLCLWLAWPLIRHTGSAGERERIRTMYGSQLVSVHDLTLPDSPVVDVATFPALADLAKRYESMIMHLPAEVGDTYLVWDNGMLYRYGPKAQAGTVPFGSVKRLSPEASVDLAGFPGEPAPVSLNGNHARNVRG